MFKNIICALFNEWNMGKPVGKTQYISYTFENILISNFFFLKKHFQKCMSKCLRALESCTTPEIIDVQTSYPLHCKKMTNDFFTYLSRYTNDMMRICKDIILYLTYFAVVIMVSILLVCVKLRAGQVFYFSVTNTTLYLQIFWYRG